MSPPRPPETSLTFSLSHSSEVDDEEEPKKRRAIEGTPGQGEGRIPPPPPPQAYFDHASRETYEPMHGFGGHTSNEAAASYHRFEMESFEPLAYTYPPAASSQGQPYPITQQLPQSGPGYFHALSPLAPSFTRGAHPVAPERPPEQLPPARRVARAARATQPSTTDSPASSPSPPPCTSPRNAGNLKVDVRLSPTQAEWKACTTPRMKEALNTWYERFRELHIYRQKHRDCNVPQKYSPNRKLGVWVNKQRMEKKLLDDGKRSSLTQEKIELLEQLGFVWAKRKGDHVWNERFQEHA